MNLRTSFLLARRMIRSKTGLPTGGSKSLMGAICCIALSIVPLVVVLVVADGMIQGITNRLIGLASFHVQVVPDSRGPDEITPSGLQELS